MSCRRSRGISRYFPSLQFPVFALSTFSSVSAFRNSLSKKRALIRLLPRQQSNDATAFQFERFSFHSLSSSFALSTRAARRSRQLPSCLTVYPSLSPCAVFRYARGYSPVRLGPVHVAHPIRSIQHFLHTPHISTSQRLNKRLISSYERRKDAAAPNIPVIRNPRLR